jgi:uncharacterized protein DUF2809
VLLLAFVVGIGLLLQLVRGSAIIDQAGNVLYAAAVYLVIRLAAPGTRPVVAFAVATGICVAVEAFQLTLVPAHFAEVFPLSRLVFGSTFAWPDLIGYGVGAVASGVVDLFTPERPFSALRAGPPGPPLGPAAAPATSAAAPRTPGAPREPRRTAP